MNARGNKGATQVVWGFAPPMRGLVSPAVRDSADGGASIIAGLCDTVKLFRAHESDMRVAARCCFVQFEADEGSSTRADPCVMNAELLRAPECRMRVAD